MKLQNLLIIFVVIALPVILVLSLYIGYQVDTINLKSMYDSKLIGATYDSLVAFELNTTNNKYATVSDSLVRDIEASIKTFSNAFSTSIRKTGSSRGDVFSYVPALVYALYDGYYIYSPMTTVEDDLSDTSYEHELKPYVYYTKEYDYGTNSKLVINYSLDNYVVLYNYYNENGIKEYTSIAGYLEIIDSIKGIQLDGSTGIKYKNREISKQETLRKYINHENERIYDDDRAYNYYIDAYNFTKTYNDIIDKLRSEDKNVLKITEDNSALPYESSNFNNEKAAVIKDSITNNLRQAMTIYGKKTNLDFNMPELTLSDWDKILHNVCLISFLQGLPIGTSVYNNYVIVPSTENKQFVDETNIYYIGYGGTADGCYHRLGCEHLKGDTIVRI